MIDSKADLQAERYYENTGGVNHNVSQVLMRKSEFLEKINLSGGKLGSLQNMVDRTTFGTALSKSLLGAFNFVYGGVSKKFVAANNAGNTNAKIIEVASGSNTDRYTTLTASKPVAFGAFLDYLFAVNDTDGMKTASGAALGTWGTTHAYGAPKGNILVDFDNVPYVMGDPAHPTRVYRGYLWNPRIAPIAFVSGDVNATQTTLNVDSTRYLKVGMVIEVIARNASPGASALETLTITAINSKTQIAFSSTAITVSDADEIYISGSFASGQMYILWDQDGDNFELPPNGESITAATVSNGALIVFQENTMHRWDGTGRKTIDTDVGCSAGQSVFSVGSFLFWMHKGVIYMYDGTKPKPISTAIEPILQSMASYAICVGVGDVAQKRALMYIGNISCPELTASNVWAIYNIRSDTWEFMTDIEATHSFVDRTGNGVQTMYIGDSNGQLSQLLVGRNIARNWSAKTKFDHQGAPEVVKEYLHLVTICPKPAGEIAIALDFSDEYLTLGQITKVVQTFDIPMGKLGNFASVQWRGDFRGDPAEFIGFALLFKPKGINQAR